MAIEEQYNYISETIDGTDGDDFFSLVEEGSGTNIINGKAGDDYIGFLGLAPTGAIGGLGEDTFAFSSIPPLGDPIDKVTLISDMEQKDEIQILSQGAPSGIDPDASVLSPDDTFGLGIIDLSGSDFAGSALATDVDGDGQWDYYIGIDTDKDADVEVDQIQASDLNLEIEPGDAADTRITISLADNTDGDSDPADPDDEIGDSIVNELGDGNNSFTGDGSAEEIYGQDGNDTVFGADGADSIYGNQENDLIVGEGGDDALFGGQNGGEPTPDKNGIMKQQQGTETIIGGAGDDLVYGNFGTDDIEGGADNDRLFGGQGSDLLDGGSGDDTIWGNIGTDTLAGGEGADEFLVFSGGQDRITDFDPAEGDKVRTLSGFDETEAVSHPDGMALEWERGTSEGTVVIEGQSPEAFSSDWLG